MVEFKKKSCPACGSRKITSYEGKTRCKNCGYYHYTGKALELKLEEAHE